jgi:hypothetical protein
MDVETQSTILKEKTMTSEKWRREARKEWFRNSPDRLALYERSDMRKKQEERIRARPFRNNVCCKFHPDGCQKAMEAHYLKEAEKERKAWNERVRREQRSSWCFDDAASYVLRGVFAFLKVVVSIVLVTAVIVAIACPAAIVPMLIVGLLLYSIIFHPVQFLKAVLALFVLLASLFILVCVLSG